MAGKQANGQTITLNGVAASSLNSTSFIFGNELLGTSGSEVINGTSGDDIIKGIVGADTLNGGQGNDTIIATFNAASTINGNDVIKASAYNDILHGNNHDDIIYGNAGNDTIYGDDGYDKIYGGDGIDNVDGGAGSDIIFTGNGLINDLNTGINDESKEGDIIHGEGGNEALYGDDGNDTIYSGNGGDSVDGGNGNDTIYGGLEDDIIVGGTGNDVIQGEFNYNDVLGGNDSIHGNDGDDIIYGDAGADNLRGGLGNDIIYGGTGTQNDMWGDDGSDRFIIEPRYSSNVDVIWDFNINDQNERIDLSKFNLTIADLGARIFYADAQYSAPDSNGVIQTYAATILFIRDVAGPININTVFTDPHFQTVTLINVNSNYLNPYHIMFSTNNDVYWGDDNINNITGTDDNDIIYGIGGNDNLNGGAGQDKINGGAGNDIITGGYGSDILDGGSGDNSANFSDTENLTGSSNPTGVNVNLSTGINSGGTAQGDILINIQNIIGSSFVDTLTGDDTNNTITGGAGADIIDGGLGNDTASYSTSSAGVTVNLNITDPNGQVSAGDASGDKLSNIENIIGSTAVDYLTALSTGSSLDGSAGDDFLTGGAGNDLFVGGAGGDNIIGGAGNDTVSYATSTSLINVDLTRIGTAQFGGHATNDILSGIENIIGSAFSDTIVGDSWSNILTGNAGKDTLTGGGQADMFRYIAASDSGTTSGVRDIITDFSQAQSDKIDLSGFEGDFEFKNAASFTGTAHEVNYAQVSGNTIVSVDADGNGALDFQIELTGLYTLTANDFVL